MKRFCKVSRRIILTFLLINQLYFSLFALDRTEGSECSSVNGTYFENSFNIYESKANLNNKVFINEKITAEKFCSEKFYNIILSIAEETGLLFFINSKKNPNRLLSVITEQSVPRSPPVS
jgi:hypothetical protein